MNINKIKELEKYVIALRRHFHQYPELSNQEFYTSERIKEELRHMSIPYTTFLDTGVIATMEGRSKGKSVLLRADMDALPIEENTEKEYRSLKKGVMHACGHDGHIAMLLGACKLLNQRKDSFDGTIYLVFQPAEETGSATKEPWLEAIIKNVDTAFAIHVDPSLLAGQVSIENGPRTAGVDDFSIEIIGDGGHGATPHLGTDALLTGAHLVVNLQEIVSREINPLDPVVVSIGIFESGRKANILADHTYLSGNIRFFNQDLRKEFPVILDRIAKHTAAMFQTEARVTYTPSLLPVVNDITCCEIGRKAAASICNPKGQVHRKMGTISDDFSRYLERVPGVYAFLGIGKGDVKNYPLHHPRFDLAEESLQLGARLYAEYAVEYLAHA